ncbi:MAG: DMT family transporter [Deinococcales bacterium]
MRERGRGIAGLYDRPAVLLVLATLFWAGNFILGRAVRGTVPPVALAFWRWTLAGLVVTPFGLRPLRRQWGLVRSHLPAVLLLSLLGIAAFNTLIYLGLHTTTALNAFLMQALMPVLIVAISFLAFRDRVVPLQGAGIVVSLLGAIVVVLRGHLGLLAGLRLAPGDGLVLIAVVSYAAYSALLRWRPPLDPMAFLLVTFAFGAAMLLPFYLWESLAGDPVRLTWAAVGSFAYVGVFPSILSYLCFNRGVELMGANRAGLFLHLMPLFGSVLAIVLLGEAVHPYHAVGAALIVAGIVVATVAGRRAVAARSGPR